MWNIAMRTHGPAAWRTKVSDHARCPAGCTATLWAAEQHHKGLSNQSCADYETSEWKCALWQDAECLGKDLADLLGVEVLRGDVAVDVPQRERARRNRQPLQEQETAFLCVLLSLL
jgi:hypothetical protein